MTALAAEDLKAYEVVVAAINMLEEEGPALGRPMADRIEGSKYQNMKELRPKTIRILFIFDPNRQAILLAAGDKQDRWTHWYETNIPLAEERYEQWLATTVAKPASNKKQKQDRNRRSTRRADK
ncbi:MAG: type II toxin-antitoxin system RelE/ParE family toxin [Actinomycetes bacterium]